MEPESLEELAQEAKKAGEILEDKSKVIWRIRHTNSESAVDQSKEVKLLRQLFSESNSGMYYILQ